MPKYQIITYNGEEKQDDLTVEFYSDNEELDLYPYSDDCPVVIGSNQTIIRID